MRLLTEKKLAEIQKALPNCELAAEETSRGREILTVRVLAAPVSLGRGRGTHTKAMVLQHSFGVLSLSGPAVAEQKVAEFLEIAKVRTEAWLNSLPKPKPKTSPKRKPRATAKPSPPAAATPDTKTPVDGTEDLLDAGAGVGDEEGAKC